MSMFGRCPSSPCCRVCRVQSRRRTGDFYFWRRRLPFNDCRTSDRPAFGAFLVLLNTVVDVGWRFGCMSLCALLYRSWLIPMLLAVVGFIAYASLMTGAIAESFEIQVGPHLLGARNPLELGMPVWLFIKDSSRRPTPVAPR